MTFPMTTASGWREFEAKCARELAAAVIVEPRASNECGRCKKCHPGKQYGGDSFCRARISVDGCGCHKKEKSR